MVSGEGVRDLHTRQGFSDAAAAMARLLFTVSFSILHDQELCADAVQNALLKAWRSRRSLRDPEKFNGWLVKIVMNESKTLLRRPATLPLREEIPAGQFGHEVKLDVANAVLGLDERYRIPIALFYFEDMPVSEIAALLDLPKGTVISRLSRAREKLRKELKDYDV
ncbi:MAG: sigma-70 family RNA polymerase sigma factor [Clostridiaceae bacterium]|nr:sigma-70 family RNA polymerase sigma factor [Eubacteriales bacterium]